MIKAVSEAVELGWISEGRIDESVLRVLRLKYEYFPEQFNILLLFSADRMCYNCLK